MSGRGLLHPPPAPPCAAGSRGVPVMRWGEEGAGERSRPSAMRAVYRCRSGIGLTPVCAAVLLGITDVSCPILPIIKMAMGAGKACQVLAGSPGGYKARDNRNRRDRACTVKDGKRLTLSSVSLYVEWWHTYMCSSWWRYREISRFGYTEMWEKRNY